MPHAGSWQRGGLVWDPQACHPGLVMKQNVAPLNSDVVSLLQCCTVIGWFFPGCSQSMHLSPQKKQKNRSVRP